MPERMPADSRSVIIGLSFGGFVKDAGQYVIWVIMSVYLYFAWSMSYIDIGLVFLASGLCAIPVTFYGGRLIDRHGRRKPAIMIAVIMLLFSVSLFILVSRHLDLILILSLFILFGVFQAFDYVVMTAIIADVTIDSERINGFSALRIASNIGIGAGLVVGGFLSIYSYSYVFILPALGYAAALIIILFRIPETAPSRLPNTGSLERHPLLNPLKDMVYITVSFLISLSWFITGMFESSATPLYFESVSHMNSLSITVLFTVNTIVVVVLQKPMNRLVIKWRDSMRIVVGILFYGVAFAMFAITANYPVLVMCVVLLTMGENMSAPASTSLVTKLAPEESRGAYLGLNSSISGMISPFRPLFGSLLLTVFVETPSYTWLTISSFCILISMSLLLSLGFISRKRVTSGLPTL